MEQRITKRFHFGGNNMKTYYRCRIFLLLLLVFIIINLIGCNMKIEINKNPNLYSREWVFQRAESIGFGLSYNDDIEAILYYLYNNPDLKERFGEDFEISEDDDYAVVGGSQKTGAFAKATAQYEVKINDVVFCIKAEKSFVGKWEVVDFYEME